MTKAEFQIGLILIVVVYAMTLTAWVLEAQAMRL